MVSIFLNIKTTYFRIFEWLRVIARYYTRDVRFLWIDFLLALHYLWKNPHRVSKAFLRKKGEKNVYGFGETPLTTLAFIAKKSRILSKDIVYELGCGTARTCFWLRTFVKCHVVGVDYLPTFIQKAERVKRWSALNRIDLINENILNVDLRNATCVYLYGTCLEDSTIEKLVVNFNQLKSRTKVITVSYPLTDYTPEFIVTKQFTASFPWGKAEIFLNEKV